MTNVNGSNLPVYFNEAKEAGKALTSMAKNEGKAEALAIHALYEGWNAFEWNYSVKRRGDETDAYAATLDEMDIDPVNADGSSDGKRKAERFSSLLSILFGVTDATNAQQAVIRRAILSARFLVRMGATCNIKSGNVQTEYKMLVEEPGKDASDNDKEEFNALKDTLRTLDGKKGMSLGELRKRAEKACPPRNRKVRKAGDTKEGEGVTLLNSIKFVSAIVAQWNNPEGETEIAPNPAIRTQLYALQMYIAEMFKADPLDIKETEAA